MGGGGGKVMHSYTPGRWRDTCLSNQLGPKSTTGKRGFPNNDRSPSSSEGKTSRPWKKSERKHREKGGGPPGKVDQIKTCRED